MVPVDTVERIGMSDKELLEEEMHKKFKVLMLSAVVKNLELFLEHCQNNNIAVTEEIVRSYLSSVRKELLLLKSTVQ